LLHCPQNLEKILDNLKNVQKYCAEREQTKQKTKQNKINAFSLNQLLASRRLLMIEMLVEIS
jgi:hypothetical protein